MIPAEKVAALLDKQRELMETLKGKSLTGFAIIIPPEGEAIEVMLMGSHADLKSFYTLVKDKLVAAQETNQFGGVRTPGIR